MLKEYDKKIGITDVETLESMISALYEDGLNETTDFKIKKSIVEDIFGAAFVDPTDYNMGKILEKDYLIDNTEGNQLATVINETKTLFALNIQEELSEGTLSDTSQEDLEQIVDYLFDVIFAPVVEDVDSEFDFDFDKDIEEIFGKKEPVITDDDIEKLKGVVSDLVSGFGGFINESKQKVSEKQQEYKEKRQEKRETPQEEPAKTPFEEFKKSFKRPDSPAETKVKNFFKELKEKSLDLSDQVRPFVDSTIEQSKPLIDKASKTVKDGFEKTKEVSKDVSKDISEYVKSDLKADVADLGNKAEDFVSGLSKQEDVPSLEDIFKALGKDPKDVSFEEVDAEYQKQLAEKRKARKSSKGDSEKKPSKGMSIEDYLKSLNVEKPDETESQEDTQGEESVRFVTLEELLTEFSEPTTTSEKESEPEKELTQEKEIEIEKALEKDLLKLGKAINGFLNNVSEKIISTLDAQPEPTKTLGDVDFLLSNFVALVQGQRLEEAVNLISELYDDGLFRETTRLFYVGNQRTYFKELATENFTVDFLDTSKIVPEELFEAIKVEEIFSGDNVLFSLKISNGILISISKNN